MPLTSTNLEAAIPGLCDSIGYDVQLSARFKNNGAPRFVFKHNELTAKFDLNVDYFDKDFKKHYFTVYYKNVEVDARVKLIDHVLDTEWNDIRLGSASALIIEGKAISLA